MSFAIAVKNELARTMPEKECCAKAELAGLLLSKSNLEKAVDGYILTVETDNPAIARKIFRHLKDIFMLTSTVSIIDKSKVRKNRGYAVNTFLSVQELAQLQEILMVDKHKVKPRTEVVTAKNCCKRAYLRGLFLGRGFINRPEGDYHLELIISDANLAVEVQKLLYKYGVEAKIIDRKRSKLLYVKESDQIADFLRIVEANQALLEFENVRILKSMRNSVNRHVNCETANLAKTIDAAVRQTELIRKLSGQQGLEILPSQLQELAFLRVENPEATLKELGEMLIPPLSKSGVAYRMRRLEKVVEELLAQGL